MINTTLEKALEISQNDQPITAVCQDWGFSGISVFLLHLRSAENTRFQKSPTSASAKTLVASARKIEKIQQLNSTNGK
ncbi:hypothetical protein HNQ02_003834 [Flavobacterium sp. 7E]|nr:hypothetical protein [Flavobacterium sp. 7E]